MLCLLSSVCFLARQGLPLRGYGEHEESSNLHQLLTLRCEDIPIIAEFLHKKQLKYTSPEVENEPLVIMANQMLRDIAASLQGGIYYAVMVDETTDAARKSRWYSWCVGWMIRSILVKSSLVFMLLTQQLLKPWSELSRILS